MPVARGGNLHHIRLAQVQQRIQLRPEQAGHSHQGGASPTVPMERPPRTCQVPTDTPFPKHKPCPAGPLRGPSCGHRPDLEKQTRVEDVDLRAVVGKYSTRHPRQPGPRCRASAGAGLRVPQRR